MYRVGMGVLNCPGDPGCPGYVEPGGQDWQNSMLEEILGNQIAGAPTALPSSSSPIQSDGGFSLGKISGTTVMFAGAGLLLVVLLARAGR